LNPNSIANENAYNGSPTEISLLKFAKSLGSFDEIQKNFRFVKEIFLIKI
jgi:hypothetical protein